MDVLDGSRLSWSDARFGPIRRCCVIVDLSLVT